MNINGNNKLFNIHTAHDNKVSDKWEIYLSEYDRHFSPFCNNPINLLEIGIQNGGSLEIWAKYFSNANLLVGCDIDTKCLDLKYDNPSVKIIVGDATKEDTKKSVLNYTKEFDIIIEDGSHLSNHIIKAFLDFFPFLKEDGLFVVEDLHCSYWEDWEGGLYFPYSSMSFFKLLADIINREHWGIDKKIISFLNGFSKEYNLEFDEEIFSCIHSVEFVNSMCFIRKANFEKNLLGKRYIAGTIANVSKDPLQVKNIISEAPNQNNNFWSTIKQRPNETYLTTLNQIQENDTQLQQKEQEFQKIKQKLQQKEQQLQDIKQQFQENEQQLLALKQQLQQTENHLEEFQQLSSKLMDSISWRVTHPFRVVSQSMQRMILSQYKNIFIPNTAGYKIAQSIKYKIPFKYRHKLSKIIKRSESKSFKSMPWDLPLSDISKRNGKYILIVAELSIPQCKKYRVEQKVEMLRYLGYDVSVVSWTDQQKALSLLQLSDLVIFYRVPAFDAVLELFDEVKRLDLISFYDVDDLIFDKNELKKNSNNLKLDDKIKKEIYNGADLYQLALSKCKHAIASTTTLGNYMREHIDGDVYIVPNCLDEELLSFVDFSNRKINDNKIVKIVYGSGTSTHDSDFLEASEAILKILEKYTYVELVIHGILNLPKEFNRFKSQIKKIPVMSAKDYYSALNNYDINIAPLESTVFNDAKSNIKFLEASIFRLPTVASTAYEFEKVIENGENSFLANNTKEWFNALEKLILNKNLREQIGNIAFEKVMSDYRIEKVAQDKMKPLIETFIPQDNIKKKIDVLMVNILFHPISFGGATIVVEEISKALDKSDDFNVTLFTGFWNAQKRQMLHSNIVRYEAGGLPIIGVKFSEPMTPALEYKNTDMKDIFLNVLKSLKPDVVHFHSIQQLSASIIEACIELKIPYVITLHDMWWLCEKQFMVMDNGTYCAQKKISVDFCVLECVKDRDFTLKRDRYLRTLLKKADLLLTPSNFQSTMYLDDSIDTLNVNKNGILFPQKDFLKSKREDNKIKFAYLGGNAVHKGYYWLKEIFESIKENNYDLVLVDLHKKLGMTSINESEWNISGNLTISNGYEYGQKGLDDFFKDIDVLLFPSQWKESFGLTIREALVRGVWVITTDAGGVVEDIVNGENGNVINMNNQEEFKRAIISLLANPSFFSSYENQYKSKIRSFKEQSSELIDYYKQVLDRRDV